MSSTLRLVAATLTTAGLAVAAAPAAAQEGPPGACACAVPAAPVAVAAAPELPRWGLGLRMSSLALAPESTPDAESHYGGGGFQLRYRVRPRWVLELSSDRFREQLEDGGEGDRYLQSVTLAAQYHFNPYARWDWYALVGVGGTGDGSPDISEEQREASQTGHVAVGFGVERRFRRFGISAELRALGLAPAEHEHDTPATPTAPAMTVPAVQTHESASGGQFSLAATYWF